MSGEKNVELTDGVNPWEGMPWSEIVQAYEEIYARWKGGEPVEPPVDCPLDDLLPAMLRDLTPLLRAKWEESNRLLDDDKEEEGMKLTGEVFGETGFSRITELRREMGAQD